MFSPPPPHGHAQDDFHKKYGRSRRDVEVQVQQTFHDELASQCQNAQSTKKRLQYRARTQRRKADREQLEKAAEAIDFTSCDSYNRWFG